MVNRTYSIVEAITAANFIADATQVERLASTVVEGQSADGTYLRVILAHMQANLGKRRGRIRAAADAHAAEVVLDGIHESLYPSVLKGVGPEDLPINERNRRATFARSAASTVRYFIRGGGDVRKIDVTTATKSGLRKAVGPASAVPAEGETRMERAFRKAQDALVRNAQKLLVRGDPDAARERIEGAMDALEALLESMPQAPDVGAQTTTIVGSHIPGTRGTPANAPMLHRGT